MVLLAATPLLAQPALTLQDAVRMTWRNILQSKAAHHRHALRRLELRRPAADTCRA